MENEYYIEEWIEFLGRKKIDIARDTGLSRNTVRSLIDNYEKSNITTKKIFLDSLNLTESDIKKPPRQIYDDDGNTWIHGKTMLHLRKLRTDYTTEQFASLIGISKRALEGAENTSFKISRSHAEKIAGLIHSSVAEINDNSPDIKATEFALKKTHPGVHSEQHTICSICGHNNKENTDICINCGQPLTGTKILVLSPHQPAPTEKLYEEPMPGKTENELRTDIINIAMKLSGKHLLHLHTNAMMCNQCQQVEDQKNIRQSS